jgi:two-component system phosphate regulon sensor histidine kinase PhoR
MRLLKSRILWQLFGAYAAVVLLTAVAGTLIIRFVVERDALRDIETTLAAKAVLLREIAGPTLHGEAEAGFQQRIVELGGATGARLTVIAADGRVLADSEQDPAVMESHLQRPEIVQAANSGTGTASRYSDTLRTKMVYSALAVRENGVTLGYVRTALSDALVHRRLNRAGQLVLGGTLLAILLSLLPSFWFAWRLSRRLADISRGAQAAADGNLSWKLGAGGATELDETARSINLLAANLRDQLDTAVREHNQIETILGGMVEGVVAVDAEERVLHLNRAAQALCEAAGGGWRGEKVWKVLRVPAVLAALESVLRNNRTAEAEVRIPRSGGDQVVETICAPLLDAQGSVIGAVAVLHDVSRLRQLEGVRREFVANASHELKTPITVIQGIVETLLDDNEMDAAVRTRFLGSLGEQSRRMQSLVEDMLALSRAESRDTGFEMAPLDLCEVAQESHRALAPAAEGKQLALTLALPVEPVMVNGDRRALALAVDNLLDNAIKYTPEGGSIRLAVTAAPGLARLEVQDTGVGIASEHLAHLFERFYRVDKARSRELGGTGLGLSIVKHTVSGHGGDVRVSSQPGVGSTFTVELPLLR